MKDPLDSWRRKRYRDKYCCREAYRRRTRGRLPPAEEFADSGDEFALRDWKRDREAFERCSRLMEIYLGLEAIGKDRPA